MNFKKKQNIKNKKINKKMSSHGWIWVPSTVGPITKQSMYMGQ
jgi:hypothetical protein